MESKEYEVLQYTESVEGETMMAEVLTIVNGLPKSIHNVPVYGMENPFKLTGGENK